MTLSWALLPSTLRYLLIDPGEHSVEFYEGAGTNWSCTKYVGSLGLVWPSDSSGPARTARCSVLGRLHLPWIQGVQVPDVLLPQHYSVPASIHMILHHSTLDLQEGLAQLVE